MQPVDAVFGIAYHGGKNFFHRADFVQQPCCLPCHQAAILSILLTFLFIKQQQAHGRPLIAIYRRLVLSSYFYLLLLFVGQNRAFQSLLHITPMVLRFLQFSTNKTFEGQLKPSKPFSYRSFSWLTLCGCQARNKKIYKKISPTRVSVGSEPI